jgi:blue copper oxidase
MKLLKSSILSLVFLSSCNSNNTTMMGNMGNNTSGSSSDKSIQFSKSLQIPSILNSVDVDDKTKEFNLTIQKGKVSFENNLNTNTYGYNGDFLGPVIRVKSGKTVKINVRNNLDEDSTIHWHGLNVNGDMDGGPHQVIKAGGEWHPSFKIDQQAGTYWFHPHTLEKTGEQVYKGLAGLFIVDDNTSDSLEIPKNYGVDDIPLIFQDRRFDKTGSFSYKTSMIDNDGMLGDKFLVNGVIKPYFEVTKNKIRFRLLNGSNARIYNIALSDNTNFSQIAIDGGFLEKPVSLNSVMLGNGERSEVVIDFSKYKTGDTVILKSLPFEIKEKIQTYLEGRIDNGKEIELMKFVIKDRTDKNLPLPNTLATIDKLSESTASKTRTFTLSDMNMSNMNGMQMSENSMTSMFTINNKTFDMSRVDENIKLNDTEIWKINNKSQMGMSHPFHIHGMQFQILSRSDKSVSDNEKGWKDTVLIQPDEEVKIISKFKNKGMFMYHCHNLEHEDAGMMGMYEVK